MFLLHWQVLHSHTCGWQARWIPQTNQGRRALIGQHESGAILNLIQLRQKQMQSVLDRSAHSAFHSLTEDGWLWHFKQMTLKWQLLNLLLNHQHNIIRTLVYFLNGATDLLQPLRDRIHRVLFGQESSHPDYHINSPCRAQRINFWFTQQRSRLQRKPCFRLTVLEELFLD